MRINRDQRYINQKELGELSTKSYDKSDRGHATESTNISAIEDASEKDISRFKYGIKDFGDLIEIVGIIFTQTGGLIKNKTILDALIAIGKNRFDFETGKATWFDASQKTLLDHLKISDGGLQNIKKQSQDKRGSRYVASLIKNQEKAGVTWVDYKPGGRYSENGRFKYYSSQFRLVILEKIADAYFRVKNDPQRYSTTGPGSRYKNAAIEVAAEYPRDNSTISHKPKKEQSPDHARSQAQGSVLNWLKKLLERGYDYEEVDSAFNHFYTTTLHRLILEHQEASNG